MRSALLAACAILALVKPAPAEAQETGTPVRVVDDAGRDVVFPGPPRRIVSLVPVVTEIIFGLEEGARLVGRSRYDDYPPEALLVPDVGDAIRPSVETVLVRRPDLVILIGGSDNAETVRQMSELEVPSLVLLFNSFDDLHRNVLLLGRLLGREDRARAMWNSVESDLAEVALAVEGLARPTVYYDAGYPPAFTIGAGSYLDSLLTIAGGRNVFADLRAPSPQVSFEAILARDPDLMIHPVGSERASPPGARPGWKNLRAVRDDRVVTVPAGVVHRLGPRVGLAARYLAAAIHPEAEKVLLP